MAQRERINEHSIAKGPAESLEVMNIVITFLGLFMPETLVKRVLSMVLIAAGLENFRVTELTGYCDKSVRGLRKDMQERDLSSLLNLVYCRRQGNP